jgi:hypothetical protein
MCYQLRIKLKELAGEVKANKFEQQKMLKQARRGHVNPQQIERLMQNTGKEMDVIFHANNDMTNKEWDEKFQVLGKLWRRIKVLEAEASKSKCPVQAQQQLRHDAADARDHLIKKVRPELRATNIAYGYIKGRSYVEMEGLHNLFAGKWNVQWHRVAAMVYSYGSQEAKDNFPLWLANIGIAMERTEVKKGQFVYKFYQTEKFVTKVAA